MADNTIDTNPELDFQSLVEAVNQKQKEKAESVKISYKINGVEKEFGQRDPVVPVFPNNPVAETNFEEEITSNEETQQNSIRLNIERVIANSVGKAVDAYKVFTVPVTIEQKAKVAAIKKSLKVAVGVVVIALFIRAGYNNVERYSYLKPIEAVHMITMSDAPGAEEDVTLYGFNIGNRLIEEKQEYDRVGQEFNVKQRLAVYMGILIKRIRVYESPDERMYEYDHSSDYKQSYHGWVPGVYQNVKYVIENAFPEVTLPDTYDEYLEETLGIECKTPHEVRKGTRLLIKMADAYVSGTKNPIIDIENEIAKMEKAERKEARGK